MSETMDKIAVLRPRSMLAEFLQRVDGAPIVQVQCLHCHGRTCTDLRVVHMLHAEHVSMERVRGMLRCARCGSPAIRVRGLLG